MYHSKRQQASAFSLPIGVLIIIPVILLFLSNDTSIGWNLPPLFNITVILVGLALIFSGLTMMIITIRMFSKVGEGTLAPWAPTRKLVIKGIYQRTRNPMILGVLIVLIGEAILLSSVWLFLWFVIATVVNHFYFIRFEEPGLVERFGDAYRSYKENVPRWIPRRKPWNPTQDFE
ncbi:MAG: isoprenylcysteine carboxylmethyltransferase family protein [Candidatus Thorarchaeota archaeon]|nr:MAG: isoprenylcysteine carboxylmethyltransferase family protein [Candidatus Thorarchaeota archaeon]